MNPLVILSGGHSHSDVYFPSGLKSLQCLWTNFIHFSRKTASVGNWCIVIPGYNNVLLSLCRALWCILRAKMENLAG